MKSTSLRFVNHQINQFEIYLSLNQPDCNLSILKSASWQAYRHQIFWKKLWTIFRAALREKPEGSMKKKNRGVSGLVRKKSLLFCTTSPIEYIIVNNIFPMPSPGHSNQPSDVDPD